MSRSRQTALLLVSLSSHTDDAAAVLSVGLARVGQGQPRRVDAVTAVAVASAGPNSGMTTQGESAGFGRIRRSFLVRAGLEVCRPRAEARVPKGQREQDQQRDDGHEHEVATVYPRQRAPSVRDLGRQHCADASDRGMAASMRNSTITITFTALATVLTLSACPRPKDDDGGKDDGARDTTGTETGTEPPPKPQF
jgi:hypothetical protein